MVPHTLCANIARGEGLPLPRKAEQLALLGATGDSSLEVSLNNAYTGEFAVFNGESLKSLFERTRINDLRAPNMRVLARPRR